MNILSWIVAALGVVCIVLAALYLVVRLRNSALAKDLSVTRNQKNNLIGENVHLQDALEKARAQCDVTAQAFTELDSLHQKTLAENKSLDEDNASMAEANAGIAKERDKWMRLYNELLTTYHTAQGDAHATVPLQEVAPEPEQVARYATVLDAAKPVKRTRKKAGAQ